MNLETNRRFWDEKAQENAYWYVSSYGPYEERNLVRRWLKERLHVRGPRGLYQRAWVGIRPSQAAVRRLSPLPRQDFLLHSDKWLFQGRKGEPTIAP